MNIKHIISGLTGYWLHKKSTLPIGADLFFDISDRLRFGALKTVFDVGANVGQTVRWIRHHQPGATVYSFEPVSAVFSQLQQTIAEVGGRCIAEQMAFADQPGEKNIRLYDEMSVLNSLRDDLMSREQHAREETIRMDTIDRYCRQHGIDQIDLLKIDTEGYELNVLRGATEMLQRHRIAFVYCECGFTSANQRNTKLDDLCRFLEEREYMFYGLYQVSDHDWQKGMNFGNALFVHTSMASRARQ